MNPLDKLSAQTATAYVTNLANVLEGLIATAACVEQGTLLPRDLLCVIDQLDRFVPETLQSFRPVEQRMNEMLARNHGHARPRLGKIQASSCHSLVYDVGERLMKKSFAVRATFESPSCDVSAPETKKILDEWIDGITMSQIGEVKQKLEYEHQRLIDYYALEGGDPFYPASWFEAHGINGTTLRQAALETRKKKKVRKKRDENGMQTYSVVDARNAWPELLHKKPLRKS